MSPPGKNSGETTWQSVDMTIRPPGSRQQRLVVALRQPLVVEGGGEQLLDELRHRPPAGAVREVDAAVPEVERADVAGA